MAYRYRYNYRYQPSDNRQSTAERRALSMAAGVIHSIVFAFMVAVFLFALMRIFS